MKRFVALGALAAALVSAAAAGASPHRAAAAVVGVFPAATSFGGTTAPAGAASSVSLGLAVGGVRDSVLLVNGAHSVGIDAPTIAAPLQLKLFFAHYVSIGGSRVPDALLPWDGSERQTEQRSQPLWLQVSAPAGTPPGTYAGQVQVVADDETTTVPISVRVFPVTLPAPNQVAGSLLTGFNVAAQSYGNRVNALFGVSAQTSIPELYSFLASYRISPNSWGYGAPSSRSGYASDKRWWKDDAGQMTAAVGDRQFAAMAIPISNNRTAPRNDIAGLSPNQPQTWCSYLQAVHGFWQQHDWLASYPYLYGMDEPGLAGFRVVAQQAKAAHSCFPGSHVIVTGNPSSDNSFLWNGGPDDVDAWVVLANRYYGKYTNPAQSRKHISHATDKLKLINRVRARGHAIWTYTYPGTRTPGFTASEPLSDARVFFDWAALENISGVLYGEGTTTYQGSGSPLNSLGSDGAFVLVYPGKDGPVASARLEQIRAGIEDWEILNVVRRKHGAGAVRKLLGGLFSTTASGVRLGCTIGCPLKTKTPFSWPTWSHDATTPAKLQAMQLKALSAASS